MVKGQDLPVQEKKELTSKEESTIPARYYVPYTDIYETDDALTVVMEIPGVDKKDVKVGVEDDVLRVEAQIDFKEYSGLDDAPMKPEDLQTLGMGQFPLVIGGIVPTVNIDGVQPGQIRFTGSLLADIYLGRVTNWNDPAIAKLNPDLKLPNAGSP
jgi:PBP superfamily domain/Hsp20/alpha crystallin family